MEKIELRRGETYRNSNGALYMCIGHEKRGRFKGCAIVKSTGGWICTVSGVVLLENGCIEWDGSFNGHFAEVQR